MLCGWCCACIVLLVCRQHPFISIPVSFNAGGRILVPLSSGLWLRGGVRLGQDVSSTQGHRDKHYSFAHISWVNWVTSFPKMHVFGMYRKSADVLTRTEKQEYTPFCSLPWLPVRWAVSIINWTAIFLLFFFFFHYPFTSHLFTFLVAFWPAVWPTHLALTRIARLTVRGW